MIVHLNVTNVRKVVRIIDLIVIEKLQYSSPGQVILGDLKRDGWVLCRGITIDTKMQEAINNMAFDGHSEEKPYGVWKSIGSESNTHCMKYDHNTNYPPEWKKKELKGLLDNIENRIRKEVCGANYVIEKHNLLRQTK